ncbi:MAG: ABC transporter permease [Chloroflexi bacterium]|nr:MAG: ABC transporter permease [Chloroflexota bacterium]
MFDLDEAAALESAEAAGLSRGRLVLRRFLRRRLSVAGLAVLVFLFVLAFLGPYLSKWDYRSHDFNAFLEPPSWSHWFGTSQIGEDVYAQTLRGLQKSLIIGLLAALFSTGLAAVVGASAGYYGGWVERVLMWVVDLLLVLPGFLILAILSPTFRGRTWLLFVILLAGFSWMITARVVRGLSISLREREFVQAARFMGVPSWQIILRHLLPNMSSLLIIDATINVGGAILAETGLSYFGFGVQPPDVSLGTLIADGTRSALTFPWLFLFAGGLLITAVLAVSVVGDGLRDAFDPNAASPRGRL